MLYRLRTLLIVLALGPPLLAVAWFFAFDMPAHDGEVSVQLVLLGIVAATLATAVTWRAKTATRR
jgi:hypothetical protein